MTNPITTRRLDGLGIGVGWRCLEVGAGEGGIARWMADRVGPSGRVVAADIDTRFLDRTGPTQLEVRRLDITVDDPEPAAFDLIHCRMVLQHLADPARALARMAEAVRPGGWLMIEEADWGPAGAADPEHPRAVAYDRYIRAIREGMRAHRLIDVDFGRRVRAMVENLGLAEVGHEGATGIYRGGDAMSRLFQMTLSGLRPRIVAWGALSEEECDAMQRAHDDASFYFLDWSLFGAWGRRPG
ncbi:MAG TPA: methyltransferase domain-containing protein [Isosphaeraceae bacterium]